jgi:anti-sigma regulatory factor (Ser/Thr protein kinase)
MDGSSPYLASRDDCPVRVMPRYPVSGGADTVRAPAALAAGRGSGAGPAFQPDPRRGHTALELAVMPTAVPCARLHARNVLSEWNLAAIAPTAELVVSELVTNALAASARTQLPGPLAVHLLLVAVRQGVLVHVWDSSEQLPRQQDAADPDSEHGRGLLLVSALSADWGAYRSAGRGKVVWALVAPYGAR